MDKAAKSPAAVIAARMKRHGWSQRELARRLHATVPAVKESSWHRMVRRWVDGTTLPEQPNAELLAGVLGGKVADYFTPRESPYAKLKRETEELRRQVAEGDARANGESG